ncbi:Protein CBG08894 [Caenorhabditis briggsae]|uniref:Protein CBG08894 n=1 Tax=Caenorhabditis briggsae TaxID=6238 RepID=A8X7M6_CAEBR|nr:Protein CBG08894 [Caenorhabditis briggsae]CAP28637.1 Protein CBG08894 [Caenorhabditis briggsae]
MNLELRMSSQPLSRIARSELGLTPYRVQKTGILSGNNNLVRVQKCKSTFAGTRQNEHMNMIIRKYSVNYCPIFMLIRVILAKLHHFECVTILLPHPV